MKNKYELISFVLRAKNRQEILKQLSLGNKTATELTKATKMYKSHISRTLKELLEERLIECLNPKDREYKFYKLTRKGKNLIKNLK
ncbi:MAG: winged helix-turn-helix domain-containing protein [Nanoarchaeota archaeon]